VGVVVDSDFGPIVCDPHDRHVSRQLLKWGHYNPDEARKYQDLLQQSSTALVIGSHIGALALQLAASVDKLTCIEANPRNYDLLKLNVAMQDLSSKVGCVNVAVAEQTGSVEFLCSKDNTGGEQNKAEHLDVDFRYDQPESIQVATIPLDTPL
jgi:FkbM family methyltransferase